MEQQRTRAETAPTPPRQAARPGPRTFLGREVDDRMSGRWVRWILFGGLLVALAAGFRFCPGGTAVQAVHPVSRQVVESLAVSGQVRGIQDSRLAPPVQGVLKTVLREEGDRFKAGEELARLDLGLFRAQEEQALRSLQTAQARLAQASMSPLASEVARVQAETSQAVAVARARLEESLRRLEELQTGSTAEELRFSEGQFQAARARTLQSGRDLDRARQLWTQGALARADLEKAQTESELARQAEEQAQARLQEVRRGPRAEVLGAARAQVQAARASLQGAEETRTARLAEISDRPRPEDVQVARAQLDEARRALEVARERLDQGRIRAPYDGMVLRKLAEPGDSVGPSQPILAVSRWPQVEIRADVDESNLGRLALGQPALVTSEAWREARLEAKVHEIAPHVDPERGTVEIRVWLDSSPEGLRPGQTVSVNILFQEATELLVVPLPSVLALGATSRVMLVQDGKAVPRDVEVGPAGRDAWPVHRGLSESDLVILDPAGLQEGQRVRATVRSFAP